MQTIILEQPGQFLLTSTDAPAALAAGEALVRVARVGICGTDIHAFHGRQPFFSYPRILGHELGVEVVALAPDVQGLSIGAHCAVEPYLNCGTCIACRRDRPNCCVNLRVLGVHSDGGMREYITLPAAKLHPSERLSFEQLALVETLGIGAHAVDRAQLSDGETVLVIGAGPIGLAVMQFARLAGARVIGLDISEQRLTFARSQGTVDETVIGGSDALAQVESLTNGDLPTAVFDATGSPASMMQAFQYVAHSGRLVYVSLVQGDITFSDPAFHRREITLLATRNATAGDFRRIIGWIEAGAIDTTPWITHRATSGDFVEQFPNWLRPDSGLVKGMLVL
ncbi:MAG: zinc-binding alcohol dehydrogenase family protein [Roseiflexaceae bacterium]|nr:zinc-binding alcohol dehydrogenase family protein [Roseiflexaceae bacterium]